MGTVLIILGVVLGIGILVVIFKPKSKANIGKVIEQDEETFIVRKSKMNKS